MRRALAAAAVLAVLGVTGAAPAPARHAAGCFQAWDDSYQPGGGIEDWAQADLEPPLCSPPFQIRVEATFQAGSSKTTVNSGWVEAQELNTRASGPNTLWQLTRAIVRMEPDGGGAAICRQFYPSLQPQYNC